MSATEIAKRTGYSLSGVLGITKRADIELRQMSDATLKSILRQEFLKRVNQHQMVGDYLTQTFVDEQIAGERGSDAGKHQKKMIGLCREITRTNKDYIDMIAKIGIPKGTDEDDEKPPGSNSVDAYYENLSKAELAKELRCQAEILESNDDDTRGESDDN